MTVKAEFRVAVGRPYEYISLFVEGHDVNEVASHLDGMNDSAVLKLGEFHRSLGGALQTAWDMGHEAALKMLTEGLGATVESVEPTKVGDVVEVGGIPFTKVSESPFPEHNARPWERKMETVTKPWEAPKVADLGDF